MASYFYTEHRCSVVFSLTMDVIQGILKVRNQGGIRVCVTDSIL